MSYAIINQLTFVSDQQQLYSVLRNLATANINVSGILVLNGVTKITVSNAARAFDIIRNMSLSVSVQNVLKVKISGVPGALYQVLLQFSQYNITSSYIDEDLDQIVELSM